MPAPYALHKTENDTSAPDRGNGRGQSQPYAQHAAEQHSSFWDAVVGAEQFLHSVYYKSVEVLHQAEETVVRARHLGSALVRGDEYAGTLTERRLEMRIEQLKKVFIPGLLFALGIVAATTFLGAAIVGTVAGILSGGTLALPGAIVGGEIGFDAGMLLLDVLGIGALLIDMLPKLPGVFDGFRRGAETAWNAGTKPNSSLEADIEKAAQQLAEAETNLIELIVEGVLVWLLSKSAVARAGKLLGDFKNVTSLSAIVSRARALLQAVQRNAVGIQAALAAAVGELVALLRRFKLTEGLADFVETLPGRFEEFVKILNEKVKRLGAKWDEDPALESPKPKSEPAPKKPTYKWGQSDGGPGKWGSPTTPRNDLGAAYQEQVTGAPAGTEYKVPLSSRKSGYVDFDGYDPERNVLLDAKDYNKWPPTDPPFLRDKAINDLVGEADDQVAAANGTPIEWHVPTQAKAVEITNILKDNGVQGITVVTTPK